MWEMLRGLVFDSLSQPRDAAGRVLALKFDLSTLVMAATAASCLVAVFSSLILMATGQGSADNPLLLIPPFAFAVVQFVSIFLSAMLFHHVGRAFGGTGSLHGAITISVWLAVVQVSLQPISLAIGLVSPSIASVFQTALSCWLLWVMAAFVAVLHGFQNTGKVLFSILALLFGFILAVSVILAVLQVSLIGTGAAPG